jgi:hypothetical protein
MALCIDPTDGGRAKQSNHSRKEVSVCITDTALALEVLLLPGLMREGEEGDFLDVGIRI